MKIYTRKGDSGQTRLIGGTSISKAAPRLEAYGTVDEFNSFLGLAITEARAHSGPGPLIEPLIRIQNELFIVGGFLACEKAEMIATLPGLPKDAVTRLEQEIDGMTAPLPPLKEFILPGGSILACHLHAARTICRRAERRVIELVEEILGEGHSVPPEYSAIVIYLNRLSDYLFTAARYANHLLKIEDHTWKK